VTHYDIICGPEGKPGPDRHRHLSRPGAAAESRYEEYKEAPQLTRKRVHVETMEWRCARRHRQVNSYQGRPGRRTIPVAVRLKKGAIEIPILQSLSIAKMVSRILAEVAVDAQRPSDHPHPLHHAAHAAMVMVGLAGFLILCFPDASFRRNHQAGYGSSILQGDADDLSGIDDAPRTCRRTH
jgi:hypothetical protein